MSVVRQSLFRRGDRLSYFRKLHHQLHNDDHRLTDKTSDRHNARAKHQRGPLPHDDGEIDELARSYSEDSMNDLSEEPATQSRKTGRGKGRGKGKGKRIIESDDDFELIEEGAKSEDTAQSVDEDVLIYHREVSLALNRAES